MNMTIRMKYLFYAMTCGALLLAVGGFAFVTSSDARAGATEPQTTATTVTPETDFASFPVDGPVPIDFNVDQHLFGELSDREQVNQFLDWLLYTVVSSSNLSTEKLNQVLFDLPPVRYGYVEPVANFEYGPTRSVLIGSGQVVALVPQNVTAEERADLLARVADQHRKNTGEIPAQIFVFDYTLNMPERFATLVRRAPLEGASLFTEASGYYEAELKNQADLLQFMNRIDDLTYARITNGVLIVGGRDLYANPLNISVEDVAAVWQSEESIKDDQDKFIAYWQPRYDAYNRDCASPTYQYNWNSSLYSNDPYMATLMAQMYPNSSSLNSLYGLSSATDCDTRLKTLESDAAADRVARGLVRGSGFSLDPDYDYEGLLAYLEPDGNGYKLIKPLINSKYLPESLLAAAQNGLINKDILPSLQLVNYLETAPLPDSFREQQRVSSAAVTLRTATEEYFAFQKARYDGNLEGTEVGMVLFYTDLLMKLWSQDQYGSAPSRAVDGFVSDIDYMLPPVYKEEIRDLPYTRQWLGPLNQGFQITPDSGLLFARNATRIYAASSNPLEPGVEVPPNAASARFLNWWNDHYEEVAQFEPQYERLNQIMKWSLLIGWLNDANQSSVLKYLDDVSVSHDKWFPDWVRSTEGLTFTKWDRINFYNRGYLGTTTEAMPRLRSRPHELFNGENTWYIIGGVSLADTAMFSELAPLPSYIGDEFDNVLLRSNIEYSVGGFNDDVITTLNHIEYTLDASAPNVASVTAANVGEEVHLRGVFGDVAPQAFERTVTYADDAMMQVGLGLGDTPIGQLKIGHSGGGFDVGWKSLDLDAGASLGRELSKSSNPSTLLQAHPDVAAAFETSEGFIVKLKDSEGWLKLHFEDVPSAQIEDGVMLRTAAVDADKTVLVSWVDNASAEEMLVRPLGSADETTIPIREAVENLPSLDTDIAVSAPRDIDKLALEIAADPVAFKANAKKAIEDGLKQIDDDLAKGSTYKALETISQMESIYGSSIELDMRTSIAYLAQGRMERLTSLMLTKDFDGTFWTEISNRLNQSVTGKTFEVGSENGVLFNNMHLSTPLEGVSVKPIQIEEGAHIYVQDSPQLNNLDWNGAPETALRQVSSGELGEIIMVPRGTLDQYSPTKIFLQDETVLKEVTKAPPNFTSVHPNVSSNSQCSEDNPCTYVVKAK